MNAAEVFKCPDCGRCFHANGQTLASQAFACCQRCPDCEALEQDLARETERQRQEIERDLEQLHLHQLHSSIFPTP